MRMFDVQGIEIHAPRARVFESLRHPGNLPQWAHAFVSAAEGQARLETPAGADIYGLALRMLWNREDAEDATQEILVRVVTRLSQL